MAADLIEAMTGRAEDVDVHFELPDDVRIAIWTKTADEILPHARRQRTSDAWLEATDHS